MAAAATTASASSCFGLCSVDARSRVSKPVIRGRPGLSILIPAPVGPEPRMSLPLYRSHRLFVTGASEAHPRGPAFSPHRAGGTAGSRPRGALLRGPVPELGPRVVVDLQLLLLRAEVLGDVAQV